jgi:hypothetical protein
MLKVLATALWGLLILGWSPASARIDCTPHCDYVHDYGPYDFTYIRPGLYGLPRCGPTGDCSPDLVYSPTRTRVIIRPRPRTFAPYR